MKFAFDRRIAHFGKVNIRNENHGKEKVPASDLVLIFPIDADDVDMVMPLVSGKKMSDVIWDEKGNLQTPYLSPIKVYRKPENVSFSVWDKGESNPMEFEGTTVKDMEITLSDKRHATMSCKVQLHDNPEKEGPRLRRLMDDDKPIHLEAQQEEFWDAKKVAAEKKAGKQGEMDVTVPKEMKPKKEDAPAPKKVAKKKAAKKKAAKDVG